MSNFFWGTWPKHDDPPVDGVDHFDASLVKHDSAGHRILTDNLGPGQTSTGEDEENTSGESENDGGNSTPGAVGATGPAGPTGPQGIAGPSGPKGHITYVGRGTPSILGAKPGETYLDQNDGTIYTLE